MTKYERAGRIDKPNFALSVQQPWAWAILHAGKDVENRTWKPPDDLIGRRIWLHASKLSQVEPEDIVPAGSRVEIPLLIDLPVGVILGSFLLLGTASSSLSPWYAQGAIAWRIAEPLVLPVPVPARGLPGFWSVPPEILEKTAS